MGDNICSGLHGVAASNGDLPSLVARTGRYQQRYDNGYRLVAGCVPFRYRYGCSIDKDMQDDLEVLMVTTQGGPGLLFPKGGWETDETAEEAACREAYEEAGVRGDLKGYLGSWDFKSKRLQSPHSPEGRCRAYMFALIVKEELASWPEQDSRERCWISVAEAMEKCRYEWMKSVLEQCILHLNTGQVNTFAAAALPSNLLNTEPPCPSHLRVKV
ncbi:hypothetical protein KP509_1Z027400 [Ceratopteris richardii]|nr:hypothetical protein KP509_1Z027400 [Ceratopteris richardii]KAH6559112.1 hypothetical protein KP509_1Z027400 [Ceratopteris richardii]